jgi:hypothetical protein
MGRPTIMTPELLSKLKEGFLMGFSDEEACSYAQIGKSTLYNYQQANPEFVEEKEEWKNNPILKAKTTIFNDLEDVETSKWYLERKAKREFSLRQELTGENGEPLVVSVPSVLLDKHGISPNAESSSK